MNISKREHIDTLLAEQPATVEVSLTMLKRGNAQMSLNDHGYVVFGGSDTYRPVAFAEDAVVCKRVAQ